MREKSKKQLPPMNPAIDHPQAGELESVSWIFDPKAAIVDMVHQDLCLCSCFFSIFMPGSS